MKKTALLSAAGLLLAMAPTATFVSRAGAADTAKVSIVHLSTYSVDNDNPGYLCLDENKLTGPQADGQFDVTDSIGPLSLDAGDHEIVFVPGFAWDETGCLNDFFSPETFTVAGGDNVTVGVNEFAPEINGDDAPLLTVWDNVTECLEPGHARIGVRTVAYVYAEAHDPLMSVVGDVDGATEDIASGLAYGDQAHLVADAPIEFVDVTAVNDELDTELAVGGDIALEPGQAQMVYVYGGADGDVGIYLTPVIQPGLCDVATTTTTAPSTTTTTQEVRAQVLTPRFAG